MSWFDEEMRPIITHEAAVLSATLNESMAVAVAHARDDTRRYPPRQFPHAMPMMLRCAMRLELERCGLPNGWELNGDSRLMGQLLLSNEEHALDLRFLKERRRSYPGGVPSAGRNPARIAAWSSRDVPLPTLGASELDTPTERQRTTVLWVWDLGGPLSDEHPAFTQRLVHTTSPGVYGRAVPCDLSLDLLPAGGIFDRLEFAGGDTDTDFFHVELDETAEDGD
ncbi:hypothetical protein NOCD_11080 [Nocardioides cavernae]|uniref:hypothetical protein n=1 Tax=Nocardioides TaxID=1839 RepID=UPI00138EFDEC|nr:MULTISPECIES: hypothetical protein [Nocardioides]MCK9824027.1 hypothetical protein [Nocardioides cavernae]